MKWERVKLSSCCISIADGDHQPPPKAEAGIPFVTISNIENNRFNFSGCMYVPQSYYDGLHQKRKPQKDDILYSVVGSFGIPVLNKDNAAFVFQRHIAILRPDKDVVDPAYMYYAMLNRDFYLQADATAIGAAQRTISLSSLQRLTLPLPDLPTQNRIASILSVYDDLIENNRRQIKLLEEAAQRLYREWFVELRFPGHEDVKIVDGVPEGWRNTNVNEVMTFHRGYDLTKDSFIHGAYPVVGSTSVLGYHNEYKVHGPGIVTGRSGSLGQYQFVWDDFWPHNTSLYVSDAKGHEMVYLYALLQTLDFSRLSSGGAIPSLNRNLLSSIGVLEPPMELQKAYVKMASDMYANVRVCQKVIDGCTQVRDMLLPKLMSGEMEV